MQKKFIAEMLGTMVLVLMGCGAVVMNGGATSVAAVLTIAFAFGLSVLAMVYTIGGISGCHINPAITLSMLISRRISGKEAAVYMAAQVIGGIVGSTILYLIAAPQGLTGTGANSFAPGMALPAFLAEMIFTFIFVWVVLASTANKDNHKNYFAGIAIGLTLTLIHIVCIPIDGTSVNPARSIGPAIYSGGLPLSQLWLFIVAPFMGSVLASGVWQIFKRE